MKKRRNFSGTIGKCAAALLPALILILIGQTAQAQARGIFVPGAAMPLNLADGDESKAACEHEPWPYRVANVCIATPTAPSGAERHLEYYADQVEKAGWLAVGDEGRGSPVLILKFAPPAQFPSYWRLCVAYFPDLESDDQKGIVDFQLWSRSDGCDSIE